MPKFLDDVTCYDSSGKTVSLASLSRAVIPPTGSFTIKMMPYYVNGNISWTVNQLGLKLFTAQHQSASSYEFQCLFMTDELSLNASDFAFWLSRNNFTSSNSYYPATGYIKEQWVEAGPTLKNRDGIIIGVYQTNLGNVGFVYWFNGIKYSSHNEYEIASAATKTIQNLPFF